MNDIHPIKPFIETPVLTPVMINYLWYFLGLVLFTSLIAIIWIILNKYYFSKEPPAPIIKRDYRKESLKSLVTLNLLLNENSVYRNYIQLTDILKTYLSNTRQIKIKEMTSKEIMNSSMLNYTKKQIKDIIQEMDKIKFSQNKDQTKRDIKQSRKMLKLVENFITKN